MYSCTELMDSISRKDITSSTSATAVASAYLYCSSFVMISSGAICVLFGIFPAINTTLPYSPIPLANASPNPASSAGNSSGITTRKNVQTLPAPSISAASSYCLSSFSSTGWTARTTKGIPTNTMAIVIPARVYAILIPAFANSAPIQPLSE